MKKLVLIFAVAVAIASCSSQPPAAELPPEVAAWQQRAAGITIVRDDWGIPHVTGKTDADAVFGLIYAQAEDDFNRVETNYLNAMGRLAEAGGSSASRAKLRRLMYREPALYAELMDKLATVVGWHLAYQVECGADAVVLFDTWAGALTREDYVTHVAPWSRKALAQPRLLQAVSLALALLVTWVWVLGAVGKIGPGIVLGWWLAWSAYELVVRMRCKPYVKDGPWWGCNLRQASWANRQRAPASAVMKIVRSAPLKLKDRSNRSRRSAPTA